MPTVRTAIHQSANVSTVGPQNLPGTVKETAGIQVCDGLAGCWIGAKRHYERDALVEPLGGLSIYRDDIAYLIGFQERSHGPGCRVRVFGHLGGIEQISAVGSIVFDVDGKNHWVISGLRQGKRHNQDGRESEYAFHFFSSLKLRQQPSIPKP